MIHYLEGKRKSFLIDTVKVLKFIRNLTEKVIPCRLILSKYIILTSSRLTSPH